MNILIINTFYFPNIIGGTENSIKILAENLKKKGHNIYVFTCDSSKGNIKEVINGVVVYRAGIVSNDKKNKLESIKNRYEYLKYVLEETRPDVVNTNNLYGLYPFVWRIVKKKKIKVVHTIRDYWMVCPKGNLLDKNNIKCGNPKLKCKLWRIYFKNFSKYVDRITAPSKYTLELFEKYKYFKNTISIPIHNCIDYNDNKVINIINEKAKRKNDIIEFMFIGNLLRSKGIENLLESFLKNNLENIRLTICGDGELKEYVIQCLSKDSRINYVGRVNGELKDNILKRCDVLVVPSIWDEPFGRVILEAYKYGMPVIGSQYGGIPEVISNESGIIVNPNNEELGDAITYMANRENIKLYYKGIYSKLQEFSVDINIDKYEELFKNTVK